VHVDSSKILNKLVICVEFVKTRWPSDQVNINLMHL